MQVPTRPRYVLITPARNEGAHIAQTIESISSQTCAPLRWVIVNDGSTDDTRAIIECHAARSTSIVLVNLARSGNRGFAGKANAFRAGLRSVADLHYDYIGNLDADIMLAPDYYEAMLGKLCEDATLGIVGGIVYTKIGTRFVTSDANEQSVGGAVQLFRRECFEAVGGYMPLQYGGIDAAAEIRARMLGWRVKKFPSHKVMEMRRTGSAEATPVAARVREGRRFHSLGYDLLFYVARSVYRLKDRPIIIGSLAALYGFLASRARGDPVLVPKEMEDFLRREQREQLRKLVNPFK